MNVLSHVYNIHDIPFFLLFYFTRGVFSRYFFTQKFGSVECIKDCSMTPAISQRIQVLWGQKSHCGSVLFFVNFVTLLDLS